MSKNNSRIKGKAFVLGDNIDTDQIIPAAHLVYSLDDPEERKFYGQKALTGVPDEESGLPEGNIPLVEPESFESEFSIIVAGSNFGCGSSREHAPASLEIAGIQAIIAHSYARIFYRNSVDGGFVIPYESVEDLSRTVNTHDELEINPDKQVLLNLTQQTSYKIKPMGSVAEIVSSGGIFKYARKAGLIAS